MILLELNDDGKCNTYIRRKNALFSYLSGYNEFHKHFQFCLILVMLN